MNAAKLFASAKIAIDSPHKEVLNRLSLTKLASHSQEVEPNTLFIAIRGFHEDGHDYLDEAWSKGARLAVVERIIDHPIPQIKVSDTRAALAHLASAFYGHPSGSLQLIGITGTNGKTTATNMIHHILHSQEQAGLIGSVHVKVGDQVYPASATTPDPLELHQWLARMRTDQLRQVVMEVSSHGLTLQRVAGLQYLIAGVTNISPDHLDLHKTLDNYVKAKQQLFTMLDPSVGVGVYNADDPLATSVAQAANTTLITYGQQPNADVSFTITGADSFRLSLSPRLKELTNTTCDNLDVKLKIFGVHNIYNSALSIACTLLSGCSIDQVLQGLGSFTGVPRRLQLLYDQGFKIIDDYGHNPEGIRAAINAVSLLQPSRLLVVFAVRGNRGEQVNQENGQALKDELSNLSLPVGLWLTKSEEVVSPKDHVSVSEYRIFCEQFKQATFPIKEEPLLAGALSGALKTAQEGDVILLLGAQGMDAACRIINEYLPVLV